MTTEKWFPFVKLPLSWEQFWQLPQHPAYKYEYIQGETWLTARPKCYHALLTLERRDPPRAVHGFDHEAITFRLLQERDWPLLSRLFARAFHRVPPFSLISEDDRQTAAAECLKKTRTGGDGPLIDQACLIARCDADDGERLVGVILVTLMQHGDLESFRDRNWKKQVPPNAIAQRWGRPHLTWIFTDSWNARHGVGTALLDHAAGALLELGYSELASTFLLGNESSTLWHWRNGFCLMSYPGSPRAMDRRIAARRGEKRVEST